MEKVYLVVGSDGSVRVVAGFQEALRAASSMKPPVRIYRAVLVAEVGEEELRELRGGEGEAAAPTAGGGRGATLAIVVFDQMFRGFGEVVKRELGDAVEVHEVVGKGIDSTVESGGVYYEPATSDYDVLKLLERLAERRLPVVFFTGDKKLARQARMLEGVVVEYLPPSEVPGKEIAIRRMLERIRGVVEREWSM